MELSQFTHDKITGHMSGTSNGTGGDVHGTINNGDLVEFVRKWNRLKQHYTLALSAEGRTLNGSLYGDMDPTMGSEFEAHQVNGL